MLFGKLLSGFGVVVTVAASSSALAAPAGTPATGKAADKVKAVKKEAPVAIAGEPDWQGQKGPGAWVWADDKGTHLRFADATGAHHLSAHLCAQKVGDVKRVGLEDGDKVTTTKNGTCAMARLTSDASIDGLDLAPTGAEATFDLVLDGRPMKADLIHLGKGGASPAAAKFTARLAP